MSAAILLVDDEKTVLDSLKNQLRHVYGSRFAYETAENVGEAWEVIQELMEDEVLIVVVVSDWLMPDVRGDEFLYELKQRHPNVVRILLTGQADEDALERARQEAEVHRIFRKPWKIGELSAAIEEGLAA